MSTLNPLNPTINSYQPMLQESILHFLSQYQAGISDFSHFNLMFSRLIQSMPNPHIEIVWFYAAINHHTTHNNINHKDDNFGKIAALKELFQLLISCSGPCSGSLNRIAVLAPLIFELHSFALELQVGNVFSKVVVDEISCLLERLVSYISLCCCEGVGDHDDSLAFSQCFVGLVKVWTVGRRGRDFEFEDEYRMFFPLIGDEVRHRLWLGSGVGLLAGVVMCQAFLLSLWVKFRLEDAPQKINEVVVNSAVNIVTGFRSCYFFDTLLKMLLESGLPVTSLLTDVDEVVLREALFDAVILVDYPFFNPEYGIHFCSSHLNSLASTWLFVADKAMHFMRHNADQTKVINYTKAFCKSLIHSQLLRWVSNQIGMVEDANKPNLSTPAAFLGWIIQLRNKALRGFDNEFSLLLDKAMHYKSEMICELPFLEGDDYKEIYLDQKEGEHNSVLGDFEMIDSTDGALSGCTPDFAATHVCGKRKGEKDEDCKRLKLLKYQIHSSPMKNFSPFQNEVGFGQKELGGKFSA